MRELSRGYVPGSLQALDDRRDMQRCGVERRKPRDDGRRQQQRQLGSAENHTVDPLRIAHAFHESDDFAPGLVAEVAGQELGDIAIMDPGTIGRTWRHHDEPKPRCTSRLSITIDGAVEGSTRFHALMMRW